MADFHALRWATATSATFLPAAVYAAPAVLDWHQPAAAVVEQWQAPSVLRINESLLLPEAEALLSKQASRYAVVLGTDNQVSGIVMSSDLRSRQTLAIANLLQLPWHELQVSYVMQPANLLPVIHPHDLANARIGDLAATMQASGRDVLWVGDTDAQTFSGVITSLHIMAATGESVRLYPQVNTFADVFQALHHKRATYPV